MTYITPQGHECTVSTTKYGIQIVRKHYGERVKLNLTVLPFHSLWDWCVDLARREFATLNLLPLIRVDIRSGEAQFSFERVK